MTTTIIEDRDNSRQVDWHLWTDSPAMDHIVCEIAKTIEKGHLAKRQNCLRVLVTNIVANALIAPKRYVAYLRSPGAYPIKGRYNEQDIGYEPMIAVADGLISEKWCTGVAGDRSVKSKDRKATRIRAAEKLFDLIEASGIRSPAFRHHPNEELIVLRDHKEPDAKKGKDIDYDESEFTTGARERIRAYNDMMLRHRIDPPTLEVSVDVLYQTVRRIFCNRSFDEGGRFYGGWWQGLNEDERANIRLDGMSVVELDYRGVHLYLAYRGKSIVYRDDPYELESLPEDARPVAKTALLVLLNAKKKKSEGQGKAAVVSATRKSILHAIENGEGMNRKALNRFSGVADIDTYLKGPRMRSIVDEMVEKHPDLAGMFFSGNGSKLQRLDSDLADYVIGKFVALDKPILPIHDSFVVKEEDKALLKAAMEDACREVLDFEPCEIRHLVSWFGQGL